MMMSVTSVDVDRLPRSQYLALEVLAARHRLGEQFWTFPTRVSQPVRELEKTGLVSINSSVTEKTVRVALTEAGKAAAMSDSYQPPAPSPVAAPYETLWFALLEQITARQRHYRARAEREWRVTRDIMRAVEYRAMADAMEEARDMMAALAQNTPASEETDHG
jgi:DNA-binding MarR family transcriptional regulator